MLVRGHFELGPLLSFPMPDYGTSVTCVKWCPTVFEKDGPSPIISSLKYKYVWAIATQRAVLIYTTSSLQPLALYADFHMSWINDLAW